MLSYATLFKSIYIFMNFVLNNNLFIYNFEVYKYYNCCYLWVDINLYKKNNKKYNKIYFNWEFFIDRCIEMDILNGYIKNGYYLSF